MGEKRYITHFANSVDYDDFSEFEKESLEVAKLFCLKNFEDDTFRMPRIYVEEMISYPEDEIHHAAVSWERIELYEFCDGEWLHELL